MPDRRPAAPAEPDDPKGLIRESFRIEGITDAECRSILIDWALSLPAGADPRAAMARLQARHAEVAEEHPMKLLMQAAAEAPAAPRRRGGRASRIAAARGASGQE
jgi:hypothetical protein